MTELGFGAAFRNALLVLVVAAVLAVIAKALDAKLKPTPA